MGNCCSAPEPAPTDFEPETEPEPADEPEPEPAEDEPEPAEDEPEPADERLSLEAALKMAKQYQDLKAKLEAAEQGLPPPGRPSRDRGDEGATPRLPRGRGRADGGGSAVRKESDG